MVGRRRFVGATLTLAFAGGVTLGLATMAEPASAPATTRPATADEHGFCEANHDLRGPITGDCAVVPLAGGIEEDDPWGRWDCRTMGNRQCGELLFFNIGGEWHGFDINAPDRPGCFVEPSRTIEGYEVIHYSRISGRGAPEFIGDGLGFEVPCP